MQERKYDKIVKELSFEDFKEKVENGEINANANYKEIFVFNLIPGEIDDMVDNFIGMMDAGNAILSVDIDPETLFKNVYAIRNHLDVNDMIFEFNPGKINFPKLFDAFACEGSMDSYLLSNYIPEEVDSASNFKQEKIDTMGWGEKQKEVDEIEAKYAAGEISIFEVYKKFGWADDESLNEEKVRDLLDRVDALSLDDILSEIEEKEFTAAEFGIFNELLKKEHPEANEKFNKEMEAKEEEAKKQRQAEIEAAKKRTQELLDANWKYNVVSDFAGRKLAVRLVPDIDGGLREGEDIPEDILEPFARYEIIQKYSNEIYIYFDPFNVRTNIALPRVIKYNMQDFPKYILDESLTFEENPDFVDEGSY